MTGSASTDFTDFLVAGRRLDAAQRERVRALKAERGEGEPVILARLGLLPEREIAEALSAFLDLPLVEASAYPERAILGETIAPAFLTRARVLPLAESAEGLDLAMADPTDRYAIDAVRLVAGKAVRPRVAVPSDLEAALARLYGNTEAPAAEWRVAEARAEDMRRLADSASEEPAIRYVNALVQRAVAARASDIHIESFEARIVQRIRVDGMLREIEPPPAGLHGNIVSRIKVLAQLDIAERRLPQDGRFRMIVEGREIDIRVSIVPTLHGESAVLRLLDRARAPLALPELGFSPALEAKIARLLALPNGIFLVTGPTGSGKTSTLYAALQRLHAPERKILTIEDPVEYQLPGVNQIPVRPAIGLTFAALLRSLLRQDPNVMLVGEIRDLETARIAVQASLTGHLVLSTVHTNDAPGTITRLLDMGLETYLLSSVLRGVLAQRRVWGLGRAGRRRVDPVRAGVARLGLDRLAAPGAPILLHEPVGCAACGGTGYHGRTVIAELLEPDAELQRAMLHKADVSELAGVARRAGMAPMREDGFAKAIAGITSLAEVLRATAA